MVKKRGLGQGLNALISDDLEGQIQESHKHGLFNVKLSYIEPNLNQPRKVFDEDALQELADSIKQYGVIQPLIVTKKGDYYEIIAGERRWRAAKLAGLKEVPVHIKEYSSEEILEISLIENIQRENLNPIEEAIAYQRLIDEFDLKQDEIAEKVSKSRSAIANMLRLLNLEPRVQQMIIDDMISNGHARALLALNDKQLQYDIASKIFDEKLSVRETEKLIKELNKPKPIKPITQHLDLEPIYLQLQDEMKKILGTKVIIHRKNENSGKIEVEYYSQEDLERLIDIFNGLEN